MESTTVQEQTRPGAGGKADGLLQAGTEFLLRPSSAACEEVACQLEQQGSTLAAELADLAPALDKGCGVPAGESPAYTLFNDPARAARSVVALLTAPTPQSTKTAVALFRDAGLPISPAMQEIMIRALLREDPLNQDLLRKLISLMARSDRAPLPDFPYALPSDPAPLDELLAEAEQREEGMDAYLALWMAMLQHPDAIQPSVELATAFAKKRYWAWTRQVLQRVTAGKKADKATARKTLRMLKQLAEAGELGDLDWLDWFSGQTKTLQASLDGVGLLVAAGSDRAYDLIPALLRKSGKRDDDALVIAGLAALQAGHPDEAEAHFRSALDHSDASDTTRLVQLLQRQGFSISAELQESVLCALLRDDALRPDLLRGLIALMARSGRAPLPEFPHARSAEAEPLDTLIANAQQCEDGLDTYLALWLAILQHPASARPYAELAAAFAERRYWPWARQALQRAMAAKTKDKAASFKTLQVLNALAEADELHDVEWSDWFFALPKKRQASLDGVSLLVAAGSDRACELVPQMLSKAGEDDLRALTIAGLAALQAGHTEEAEHHFRAALGVGDPAGAARIVQTLQRQKAAVSPALLTDICRTLLSGPCPETDQLRRMVGLMARLSYPPIPETADALPPEKPEPLEDLITAALEADDELTLYALLWRAILHHPRAHRPYAELALALANRRHWKGARQALKRAFAVDMTYASDAEACVAALRALAERNELRDCEWTEWLDALPETARTGTADGITLLALSGHGETSHLVPAMLANDDSAKAQLAAAISALLDSRFSDAHDHFRRALELDLPYALRQAVMKYSPQFSRSLGGSGNIDTMADWLTTESEGRALDFITIPAVDTPQALEQAHRRRSEALEKGLPSAFLVTQPKSGSVSIGNLLSSGFKLPSVIYSVVGTRVVRPWLEEYSRGGACYVTHLRPRPASIDLLAAANANMIVHVRDPRQWIVSLMEHYRKYPSQLPDAERPQLTGDDEAAFDFTIRCWLKDYVAWISGWVEARDRLTVNFTTFDQFVTDKKAYVDRLLELYGGDTRYFDQSAALGEHAGIDYHRRKGSVDEWRERLSPAQVERINSALPDTYWEIFGWRP